MSQLENKIKNYLPKLTSVVASFIENPADREDVQQDFLLAVVEGYAKFQGRSHINTWFYRILRSTINKNLRKKYKFKEEVCFNSESLPEEKVLNDEQLKFLRKGYQKLTKRHQEVVGLFLEGYTYKEIGSKIGVTEGTVSTHMFNIKAKLRTYVDRNYS